MSKKILLADDSVTIQKVVSITLTSEDFDLTTVSDGASAISKAREIRPDLILLDISMPEKNGYQVCEEIKQDPELKDIPVLMLAGTFEPYDENEGKRAGADDHIVKPFESQDLVDKVKAMLDRQGSGEAAKEEVAFKEKDVWDITDISDVMEVEEEAITPDASETVSFAEESIEKPAPVEEKEMVPGGSIEDIAGFVDEEKIEEPFPSLEEEGVEEIPEEEIDEGAGEGELEFIEDVEPLEEIEPLEIVEEPLEEVSVKAEVEEPAHEEVKEEPFFEEPVVEIAEEEEKMSEETAAEEIEFEEIVSEEVGIDEEETGVSAGFVTETPSFKETIGEDAMFKEEISEEIGSKEITEEVVPDLIEEETISEAEKTVSEETLDREVSIEPSKINEALEEKIREQIENSLTRDKIEEVLNRVMKEVIEDVTWEVAPGLIEDIIKAEVKRIKEVVAKVKEAFTSE
ncbi:MAG: PleD family two-component system response regulator [Thermodesulfobacteriota bacterium]